MALTKSRVREILSEAGVSSENMSDAVDKIIDGHVTSINALREEVATYKSASEKLEELQKELESIKEKADGYDTMREKYEKERKSYEDFKNNINSEKVRLQKTELYKELLIANNIDEKRIDAILKVTDIDSLDLVDGKLSESEKLSESIKTEWSGFVVNTRTDGASVDTPPGSANGMTIEEFKKLSLSKQMEYANEHPAEVAAFYK